MTRHCHDQLATIFERYCAPNFLQRLFECRFWGTLILFQILLHFALQGLYFWEVWISRGLSKYWNNIFIKCFIATCAVCQVVPSCWKMDSLYSVERGGIEGTRWSARTFLYFSAFIVTSTTCRLHPQCAYIYRRTFTDGANFTLRFIHFYFAICTMRCQYFFRHY